MKAKSLVQFWGYPAYRLDALTLIVFQVRLPSTAGSYGVIFAVGLCKQYTLIRIWRKKVESKHGVFMQKGLHSVRML